ncbi:hypothetical protein JEQ12_006944 [Ovis aries]|uniref:Pre-mRNA-splicing regulator WTAP n=1 Tax=Ovis aries TaxID=9940 RepID=A0A835ZT95_SHEEP|nr:hypothetical protein JEQ12_006944 [Ovis aries]
MTNEEPLPKKEAYVQALKGKYTDLNCNAVTGLRESEEKLKQQQQESALRENILCTTQIQYLKQIQQPSVAQLRSTVDPTINLLFLKMKSELEQAKDKLEQAQNELSAWRFMPDSQTGKKLMVKCQMLIQENQELGRQLSQGSPGPSTSRTTSSAPVGQAEATCKDCSHLASGPSNGSSSWQRTSGSGFHREGYTAEDDFPSSSGNGNKASSSSEEVVVTVDSPMGSENFLTHHSNDTDSKHDPQEEKTVSGKGNRTAASHHMQNGLDSSVNAQGSVL